MHLNQPVTLNYPITKTGYYCVLTDKYTAPEYELLVEFRNAYGELPATQIPKLPFYGGITILYALVSVYVPPHHCLHVDSADSLQILGLPLLPAPSRHP